MLLKIAFEVSASDDDIDNREESLLELQIERMLDLSEFERERLRKYLVWLHVSPPDLSGLKRRLVDLPPVLRSGIAEFAIRIANVDEIIHPKEINSLKKIYRLLDFNPEEVFSDIHRLQTSIGDEPATVLPESRNPGYPIPARNVEKTGVRTLTLDQQLLERTLKETAAVQSILADVFAESEMTQSVIQMEPEGIIGLDSSHSSLLVELITKRQWNVGDFEYVCSKYGVLPAGAIEIINSRTYEIFDEPLIEEGDTIEINPTLAKEIKL